MNKILNLNDHNLLMYKEIDNFQKKKSSILSEKDLIEKKKIFNNNRF